MEVVIEGLVMGGPPSQISMVSCLLQLPSYLPYILGKMIDLPP